jgi:MCP family monocarboxylic acid transporter-like MFS transporter 10
MQHLLPRQDILLFNLIGSTQSFIVLFFSAVVGRFLDAGYIRYLLITGTILVSVGSYGLSVVNGDASRGAGRYGLIWLTQGLISGLGMACFFVSSSQGECAVDVAPSRCANMFQWSQPGSRLERDSLLVWSP